MNLAALALISALVLPQQDVATQRPVLPKHKAAAPLAKGSFLVASRNLQDPNFAQTIVLLLAYDAGAAMGVIINRPTPVKLATVIPDIDELKGRDDRLHLGGPVSQGGLLVLIRAHDRPGDAEHVFEDVYVTSSRAAIEQALSESRSGKRVRAYAGYAGWSRGQLDAEVERGDWYVTRGNGNDVFSASDPWPRLIEQVEARWVRLNVPAARPEYAQDKDPPPPRTARKRSPGPSVVRPRPGNQVRTREEYDHQTGQRAGARRPAPPLSRSDTGGLGFSSSTS